MKLEDETGRPVTGYTVDDPALEELIDAILERLKPYANLDLLREVFVTGAKLAEQDCSRGDMKILRSSLKEIRYAFKVFDQYRDIPKVTVFGSARTPPESPDFQQAIEFSRKIAGHGYMVITGAGGGIMAAGNLGAGKEAGFGLNILLPFEQVANDYIINDEKLINFRYFFSRKLFFVKESNAIVLLPGGFGTQDEGFESLTLVQTGKAEPRPIVMLDHPGGTYWKSWDRFVRQELFRNGLVSPEDESLFCITEDVDVAVREILKFYRVFHSSRYVNRRRLLVVRLRREISDQCLQFLNGSFASILVDGQIVRTGAFPEEADEPELVALPRLSVPFDQRNYGSLRLLIDAINEAG